jgi:hypothetical protein
VSRAGALALACLVLLIGSAGEAAAQSRGWPGRMELAAGAGWATGFAVGRSAAELIRNQAPAGTFTLFRTTSEVRPTRTVEAYLGVNLTPAIALEGHVSRGRPELRTTVSDDEEQAAGATVAETLTRYELDAGVVWHITRAAFGGGRGMPYLGTGAGYLRELHEGRVVSENGLLYHAAVGVKYRIIDRPAGLLKGVGVRGEYRLKVRDGGIDLEDRRRTHATVSIAVVVVL